MARLELQLMKTKFRINASSASTSGLGRIRILGSLATVFALVGMLMFTPSQAVAQEAELEGSPGGALDIKVIGDRILARVELQTELWFKDTHVIVDYQMPYTMMVQSCVMGNIRYGEGETTMRILNEDFRLEVPRAQIVPELGAQCGELTGKYDKQLDQIDIVAIIGWPLLRQFGLTLDIQEGKMTLHPEGELIASEVQATSEKFIDGVQVVGKSVFIPVNYNGGQPGFMKLNTNGYHTVLNRELLDDRVAGVVDEAYLGFDDQMKISDMAAFYPQDLYTQWWDEFARAKEIEKQWRESAEAEGVSLPAGVMEVNPPDQPTSDVLLVSGLSVLSGYRIVLDPMQGFVGMTRTVNSNYSEADHQFYMAAAQEDVDALYTYFEENPEDRNVEEAVGDYFGLGLESGESDERLLTAIDYGLAVNEERHKFMYVNEFTFGLFQNAESRSTYTDLIIGLGEKALPFVARSSEPKYRQHVQGILGDRHLARGENDQAWKYFLAAAFNGDPQRDAQTRYDLGRAYDAMGRPNRAYANYDRALDLGLPQDLAESAQSALERLRDSVDAELIDSESEEG